MVRSGLVALLLFAPVQLAAQARPYRLAGPPSCAGCSIERYRVATISDRDFPDGALGRISIPFANRDGTFFVLSGPSSMNAEIYHADRTGRITRRIGRTGGGPGEYRMPFHISETDSAYLIFDRRLSRVSSLSKRDLSFSGSSPSAGLNDIITAFPDGSFVSAVETGRYGTRGNTLNLHAQDGRVVRSFRPNATAAGITSMAPSGDSAVWVASNNHYRIEKWNLKGTLSAVYERDADWFLAWEREMVPFPPGHRYSSLDMFYEDGSGRLWVLGYHRALAKSGPKQLDDSKSQSFVEVIDTRQHRLLASSTVPGVAYAFSGGPFHMVPREDADGEPLIDVWGYRLRIPPR